MGSLRSSRWLCCSCVSMTQAAGETEHAALVGLRGSGGVARGGADPAGRVAALGWSDSMTRAKPNSCSGCQCEHHGTDFSRIDGQGSLGVMVVAEASGELEAREGRPLVEYAPAGSLFARTLRRMGYSREQFSITNCIRCRPRNNWLSGAPWEFPALNHCRPNLDAAIRDRQPRAILALGDTALRELTGEAGEARGVSHLGGYVLPLRGTQTTKKCDCEGFNGPEVDCF